MKRKVGLFLLAVIVTVTLGAALVVSMAMYRLVSAQQAQEIRNVERSLSERFTIFEVMLRSQQGRIRDRMERVLPLIAGEIERLSISPDKLSPDQVAALARKYDVEDIYFIDRSHNIFQTTAQSEMNLHFSNSGFIKFLDTVYARGEAMDRGIDFASRTGTPTGQRESR